MVCAFRYEGIPMLCQSCIADIEDLYIEIPVQKEHCVFVLEYRSAKGKFAIEFNFVGPDVDNGCAVVGPYI